METQPFVVGNKRCTSCRVLSYL
uniref:Uncharacterized protein n=1 Tax=Arundo donax TaxID=35708 RepID=A0A0A8YER4_ARUDO